MNNLQYHKISDDCYINILPITIPKEKEVKLEQALHQFLIFDRSGSMSGYLDDVMDSAIEYCNNLPEGSSVSVGYFSGMGDYNLSVPYTLKKEIDGVTKTINSYRRALGMTNFIQIIDKINEQAKKSNDKASLFFFTDGCHNTGGSYKDVLKVLEEWKKYAVVTMFVGYGYIDRDMMSLMASVTEGSFVHLDNFSNFKQSLQDFGISVEDSSPSIDVSIPDLDDRIPISISGKSIIEYTMDKGKIKYRPSKKGFKGVYWLSYTQLPNSEEVPMSPTIERGIRALAMLYSQKNNVDISLKLLAYLGDKFLIRNLYNSITADEFSQAENYVKKSIFNTRDRFVEGEHKNYLPDPNAFCVMDAINILMEDENAKMYVNDKDFKYSRISKKTEQKDGSYLRYPEDAYVSLNNLVMHKERLNVGVSTSTEAYVNLDPNQFKENPFSIDDLFKYNLPSEWKITSFRTYSIIADGKLQTEQIVVSDLSKESLNKLSSIVEKRKDGKYLIDFGKLPIINKQYVKMTSAKVLAEKTWEEKLLASRLTVLNYLKKRQEEVDGKKFTAKEGYSEEAMKFLFDHCYIKENSYTPPRTTLAADDEYEAYSFSIDIKGFSDVTAKSVIEKLSIADPKKKKEPTQREMLVAEYYLSIISSVDKIDFDKEIKALNKEIREVRRFIQLSKFAIILGNRGAMEEFSSRENMVLTLNVESFNGVKLSPEFQFNIDKVIVKI